MRRHVTAAILLFLLVITLGLTGCSSDDDDGNARDRNGTGPGLLGRQQVDRDRVDLVAARAQWEEQGIADYDWSYEVSCFCPGIAYDLQVRGGVLDAAGARTTDSGGLPPEGDVSDREPGYETVEDLFDSIEGALDRDGAEVSVTYDEETGRPLGFGVDPDEDTFDDEFGLSVTAFAVR